MLKRRKIIAFLTVCCLLFSFVPAFGAGISVTPEQALDSTCQLIIKQIPNPTATENWYIMDLARAGYPVPDGYYQKYYDQAVAAVQKENGKIGHNDSGECAKMILALTACGFDVTNVGGYNLLNNLADFNYVKKIGTMGPTWALLALDSYKYTIPEVSGVASQTTREKLITDLLARELPGGGFCICSQISEGVYDLSGSADIDATAMVIQALAPYQHMPEVKSVIDRAVQVLSEKQLPSGNFKYYGVENLESAAQVFVMLCKLGIDPTTDQRFIKSDENGQHNLLEVINEYYVDGGGYTHLADSSEVNWSHACNQGLYAMISYIRFGKQQNSLYDMTDVSGIKAAQVDLKSVNLSGQQAEVIAAPIAPVKEEVKNLFTDIDSHWAKELINTYKGLGISHGAKEFKPNQAITRAEFCVAAVNAFGLKIDQAHSVKFDDVSPDAWYYNHILKAASQGIINGKGNGAFDPEATITRQEAMIIAQNLAKKYNLAAAAVDESVLNNYSDADSVSAWAKDAVLYNLNNQIIVGSQGKILPLNNITRAETVAVFNNLLNKLGLTSNY